MSTSVAPLFGNEYDIQRAVQRQVIAFLQRVRRRRPPAAMPLAQAICTQMGTPDPAMALERLVCTVFAGPDEASVRLKEAIYDADLRPGRTNAQLAREKGVSRRHFQRRRAEAVAALAQYARTILPHAGDAVLEPSSRAFAEERAALRRAKERGRLLEMRSIAGNMLRIAGSNRERAFAAECRADANARLGRTGEALAQYAELRPAARLALSAKLSLVEGETARAEAYAYAALQTRRHDGDLYECAGLVSQARRMQSLPWDPAPASAAFDRWERVASDVERARHFAHGEAWGRAATAAHAGYLEADRLDFAAPCANAAAVLSAVFVARRYGAHAFVWRAEAIRRLLAAQDRVLACGLMLGAADGEFILDARLTATVYDRLCLVVPQMQGEDAVQRSAVCSLLGELIRAAVGESPARAPLHCAAERVACSEAAFAHYAARFEDPILEQLALVGVAVRGTAWEATAQRVRAPLRYALSRVRPAVPKTITVGPVRSQNPSADHLKLNERSGSRGESVEALADLLVRLVPL
jgi:hypothetical protein